jgi:CHAD domain-containing protein
MNKRSTSIAGRFRDPPVTDRTASPLLDSQTAFQRIAKKCVHLVQRNRQAAMAADPEVIHAMRIGLTRLRGEVLFFSPMVTDAAWPPIRNEFVG